MTWNHKKVAMRKKAAAPRTPRPVPRGEEEAQEAEKTQRRLKREFYERNPHLRVD